MLSGIWLLSISYCAYGEETNASGLRISLTFAVIKNLTRPGLWMTKFLQVLWMSVLALIPKILFCLVYENTCLSHHVNGHIGSLGTWK